MPNVGFVSDQSPPFQLCVTCRAKLNLWLRVLRRRPDGYHNIESVACIISLADTLAISPARSIALTCTGMPAGDDRRNLALRAAQAFAARASAISGRPISQYGAHLALQKRIPPEAGLGGGSSDAAGALLGLNKVYESVLPQQEVVALAAGLGSDVPLFLAGAPGCLMRGRGEVLAPVPIAPFWAVVVKPSFGVSTAWAYANCTPASGGPGPDDLLSALASGNIERASMLLHNDLEQPAIAAHPEIARIKQALLDAGTMGAMMTGSGSAVFGFAPDQGRAEAIAVQMADAGLGFAVAASSAPCGLEVADGTA